MYVCMHFYLPYTLFSNQIFDIAVHLNVTDNLFYRWYMYYALDTHFCGKTYIV